MVRRQKQTILFLVSRANRGLQGGHRSPQISRDKNIHPKIEFIIGKSSVKNPKADPVKKWKGVFRLEKTADEIVAELRGYGIESID
jgi:hypothetical protein